MSRIVLSAIFGFLLMVGQAAAQDLVVIASSASAIKAGQMVKSGVALDVPAGANVTLVSQSGKTIMLKGPFSGVPGGGGGGDKSLVSSLSKLLSASGSKSASLGAMRSGIAKEPDNPWAVDIGRSGTHCVPAGGPVTLWRGDAAKASSIKVKNMTAGAKAEVAWPAGARTLDWPAQAGVADNNTYLLRLKGKKSATKVVLHLVPDDLPSAPHKAVWMADKGCTKQAKHLLSALN
ncbi:MAG: hypothetical protein QGI13_12285 [Rhodospirillales bacterium]|jgi:hypothetical protein|nr:hypothetical protein [Rhodospirillales bacterium]